MRFLYIFLLVILIISTSSFIIAQDSNKVNIEKFGHEIHNVKPHPKAEFRTLENGFRYILLPNKTPEKKVLVYLYVNVGSLNEADNQQGIAHFLEHMAFNGTKNYSGDSLNSLFKKMGMSFGGDTNAHTLLDRTTYEMNLPDESHKDDALKIMADFAMNITFDPKEIDKERGVILSEKRERDNINSRIEFKGNEFLYPNSLIAKRSPIGIEELIKGFKHKDFLEFYQTWYRPENMVLIVVGDINSKIWDIAIKQTFDSFQAKAPAMKNPEINYIENKGLLTKYIYEKEFYGVNIYIGTNYAVKNNNSPFLEKIRINLAEGAAISILKSRVSEEIFNKGSIGISHEFLDFASCYISMSCQPGNWEKYLSEAENAIRRSQQFKFTDQELELFKKRFINELNKNVNSMETINNISHMNKILHSLSRKFPFQDANQIRENNLKFIESLTTDDIEKEYKKYWQADHRLILITGNINIKNADEKIKQIYEEASKIEVHDKKEESMLSFPYETQPKIPGKIVAEEDFTEPDFSRFTFENNVVLNIKKTDFKKNEIKINITFGFGAVSAPKDKESMIYLAELALLNGGLTKLSKNDLMKSLTGKNAKLNMTISATSFQMLSTTTPNDLEVALQLNRAFFITPGFREEANSDIKKYIDKVYSDLNLNIASYFKNALNKKISNNIIYTSYPERNIIEAITLDDLKKWITSQLNNTPIEINIAGDVDIKKTVELVATYFGTFATRQKISKPILPKIDLVKPFDTLENFPTAIKKSYIFMTIQMIPGKNNLEKPKLFLLGNILKDKVYKQIRENLALTYSPIVGLASIDEVENSYFMEFILDVDTVNVSKVKIALDSIIREVAVNGVTNEECEGAKKPLLTEIQSSLYTNDYWVNRILRNSTAFPEDLKYAHDVVKTYNSITTQQINEVAKKYLNLDNRSIYVLQASDNEKSIFSFEKPPEIPGKIILKEEFKELGFTRFTFENNIILNIKKTNFKKEEVCLSINLGHGAQSVPKGKEAMIYLAPEAFLFGGLTKMSYSELYKSINNRKINANLFVSPHSFILYSYTTTEHLETCVQLCRAKLLDAGYRKDANELIKKSLDEKYKKNKSDLYNYCDNVLNNLIAKNAYPILPDRKVLDLVQMNDIKEWLNSEFKNSTIEISVVGDIDEQKTLELFATYFGSLPIRSKIKLPPLNRIDNSEKFDLTEEVKEFTKYNYLGIAIPTAEINEIKEIQCLNLLTEILNNKIEKLIQKELSYSYPPNIKNIYRYKNVKFCYMYFVGAIAPKNTEKLKTFFVSTFRELSEKGINIEDLDVARKLLISKANENNNSNYYWLYSVLSNSTSEPQELNFAPIELYGFEEITIQQINDVAKKYLDINKISTYLFKKDLEITPFEKISEQTGKIVSQEKFNDLGVSRITFDNNIVLNIKEVKTEKYKIDFNICIGQGNLSLPKGKEGMIHLAPTIINESGIGLYTKQELKTFLSGKFVNVNLSVADKTLIFKGSTNPSDLELNLQLCRAKLTSPGFRKEGFKAVKLFIEETEKTTSGGINIDHLNYKIKKQITKNDYTLLLPEKKVLDTIELNDLKEWLTNEFNNASIEINIVGNINEEKTIELISAYFGTLPKRKKIIPTEKIILKTIEKFDITEELKSTISFNLICIILPTIDLHEINDIRKLNLLAEIFKEKAKKTINKELSFSIPPEFEHIYFEDYNSLSYFQFIIPTSSENNEELKNNFDDICKDIFLNGVSNEELELIRIPYLKNIKKYFNTIDYWLNSVLIGSTAKPKNLEYPITFIKDYEEITVQQINEIAKKYLRVENRSTYLLKAKQEAK